jgi:hypothetical protein
MLDVQSALTAGTSALCIYGFHTVLIINSIIAVNSINQLFFVMEKGCVFFEIWTEFVNII